MGRGKRLGFYGSRPFLLRSSRGAISVQVSSVCRISLFTQTQKLTSLRSLSIAFDDDFQTIRVIGRPLRFGDRHYPAPTELIIGREPRNVILTRRMTRKQDLDWPDWHDIWGCVKHPKKCAHDIVEHLNVDIDSPDKHISFDSEEYQPRKKYWPPE